MFGLLIFYGFLLFLLIVKQMSNILILLDLNRKAKIFLKNLSFTVDLFKVLRFNTRIRYIKGGVFNECIRRHKKSRSK